MKSSSAASPVSRASRPPPRVSNDFVTEIDRNAEAEIIEILRKAYPHHAFLGEESGAQGNSDTVWIIDPLDGTTNFMHGFPTFAVSIACQINGRMEHAVIYDPMRQELFTASRGDGAYLENRRLRVSKPAHARRLADRHRFPLSREPAATSMRTWR